MKRIMILITDAGGGHRASAEALRDAFALRYGERFHVDIVDLWMKHTPAPLSRLPKAYRFMVNDVPHLYEFLFKSFEKPQINDAVMSAVYQWVKKPVSRAIRSYSPDLMISVHALMQDVPLRVLRRMGLRIPFVTVVTDLATIHPAWLHPGVTLCFVPTAEAYRQALESGLRPEQVRQYGLPVRPAFAQQMRPKQELRQKLGMHPELPAVLLVGGGEGTGPVDKIAQAVADLLAGSGAVSGGPAGQMVVVCGRNRPLYKKLSERSWPIPVVVNGFVENMPEWMAASDCLITKAGPGTIAEALISGLPMVLSGYIAGQEAGNAAYVLKHGVGTYSENPAEIAEIVARWLGPQREELARMSARARELGRPQSTFHIVEEIARLLGGEEADAG